MSVSAAQLGVPEIFNAATHFVDRNVAEGRAETPAIECGDERITYDALRRGVNRFGSALRDRLGVRCEERVLHRRDLDVATEVFLSSSRIGVVRVAELDGRRLAVDETTRRIQQLIAPLLAGDADE